MLDKRYIKRIKTAQRQLGISDENYREMLGSFGAASCKDLSEDDAEKLLTVFRKIGFKSKNPIKGKYNHLRNRHSIYASPEQLELIEYLWIKHSRAKTEESMLAFIRNIVKCDKMEWLLKDHIPKLKMAIEHL